MNHSYSLRQFVVMVSAALISAAAVAEPSVKPATGRAAQSLAVKPLQSPVTQSALFDIVMAEIALQRGQLTAAFKTYIAVAQSTQDPRLAQRAVEIAYAERKIDNALEAARLWRQLAPAERDADNALIGLLVETGRLPEAEPLLTARLDRASSKSAVLDDMQRLLARAPNKLDAFGLFDRIAQPYVGQLIVRLALARSASLAGLNDRALTEARQAQRLDPKSEIAVLTTAQMLTRQQAAQKASQSSSLAAALTPAAASSPAVDVLTEFLQRNPHAIDVRFALARLQASEGRFGAARALLNEITQQQPNNLDALLAAGLLAYQMNETKEAQTWLQRYITVAEANADQDRDLGIAWLTLAQISEDQHQYGEALAALQKIESGEQYLNARVKTARITAKLGKLDDARAMIKTLQGRNAAEQQQLISAEAVLLREAKQYQASFDVLEAGVKAQPAAADLLYDYALAAEKLDKLDLMEQALRQVIALRPDDPQAYNALGYSLADRKLQLDEAAKLVEKALALSPEDAYIIDSMGWVQYRMNNLPKAIELLQHAYRLKPDPEIAAHLGEVMWVAGDRDQAEKLWRAARDRDPTNETLVQTLARHNVKL